MFSVPSNMYSSQMSLWFLAKKKKNDVVTSSAVGDEIEFSSVKYDMLFLPE